jgi:hypothetical protein
MSPTPLILLEFNELSPSLMEQFIRDGHLPNFARLRAESDTYVTDAGEDPPRLNPWIQWVTLHSGKSFGEHGVFHLGDAPNRSIPMIWDDVCAAGHSAWICGSMNISVQPGFRGGILPDPWDAKTPAQPSELERYARFVRAYVFGHTGSKRPATLGTTADFGLFMVRNGLRLSTVVRIAGQFAAERFADVGWKRASILDLLQFDLFRSFYQRHRPLLSTIFSNSTAHYQHAFWRNMQPELFTIKPSDEEQKERATAIRFGYQAMDRLVGEALKLAGNTATVAFATALSQQACLAWEKEGGKTFYKPRDHRALLVFVGLDPASCRVEPVMSEQFHLRFDTHAAATAAKALLDDVSLDNGRAVFTSRQEGASVFTGCSIFSELHGGVRIRSGGGDAGFHELFYQIEALKSGMHHRDGLLWIRSSDRRGKHHPQKLPLTTVRELLLQTMRLDVEDLQNRATSRRNVAAAS